jgi:Domain of unknown function (DUF397)
VLITCAEACSQAIVRPASINLWRCMPPARRAGLSEQGTPSTWRKSSFSQGGDCVEWRHGDSVVYLRASKDPHGAVLEFTHREWQAFTAGVKHGEADLTTPE